MLIKRLWSSIDDPHVDKEYWDVVINENFFRLYIGSAVIVLAEVLTISYVVLVIKEFLYLPFVLIPLCSFNLLMWFISLRRLVHPRVKRALVGVNVLAGLFIGGIWNMVMQGTPQAVPIYMFVVFFVAAAFIIRPKNFLLLLLCSESVFLASVLRYPSQGLSQAADIINSVLVVVLAWTISAMLFRGHQVSYQHNKVIEGKNAQLRSLYVTDRLTGLYNRYKLDEELEKQTNRVDRYGNLLSIIMIDVDNFKAVNDQHGHLAGDRALCSIAGTISSCLRMTDTLGRWGGEEFLIICPETDEESAYVIAERIRERVSQLDDNLGQRFTVSLGLVTYVPGEGKHLVLQRADNLLYVAKSLGRNRVTREDAASDD